MEHLRFLSLFDFSLTTGPLTKPNQIELKMKSGNKSENGYRKRAGRVFVLLALCVIFRILPESKTRTNESRVDKFEADWLVELDWVGTQLVPTQFKIHILSHPNSTSLNRNLVLNLLNSKPFHVSFFLFSHPFS